MNDLVFEAFENADRLYAEYSKLACLGELTMLGHSATKQEVVASVSPVMSENYKNGLLGSTSASI